MPLNLSSPCWLLTPVPPEYETSLGHEVLSPKCFISSRPLHFSVTTWMPLGASNQTSTTSLLNDPMAERNSTNSTRALWLLEGTRATGYILTIIGIFGVIFLFQLASNILRKNDKSLEDIYYSSLTLKLRKKGLQSKVAKCSSVIICNPAVLQLPRPAWCQSAETASPR